MTVPINRSTSTNFLLLWEEYRYQNEQRGIVLRSGGDALLLIINSIVQYSISVLVIHVSWFRWKNSSCNAHFFDGKWFKGDAWCFSPQLLRIHFQRERNELSENSSMHSWNSGSMCVGGITILNSNNCLSNSDFCFTVVKICKRRKSSDNQYIIYRWTLSFHWLFRT